MTAQIGQLVRTLLSDDLESYAERTAQLDESGWNAFGEIVGAAFYRAVTNRFGGEAAGDRGPLGDTAPGPSTVTAFVAGAAEPYASTPVAIDLAAGEALVRSVLGDDGGVGPVLDELDEPDLARIELVLLRALLDGSPDSLEELVASAEGEAAEFSGEPNIDEPDSAHGQISLPPAGQPAAAES